MDYVINPETAAAIDVYATKLVQSSTTTLSLQQLVDKCQCVGFVSMFFGSESLEEFKSWIQDQLMYYKADGDWVDDGMTTSEDRDENLMLMFACHKYEDILWYAYKAGIFMLETE